MGQRYFCHCATKSTANKLDKLLYVIYIDNNKSYSEVYANEKLALEFDTLRCGGYIDSFYSIILHK